MLTGCTAERFFRVDKAQENLHYLSDIANDTIYILDQELTTLPQTPEDETATSSLLTQQNNNQFSSGSSDNLERESHENTPTSPNTNEHFFKKLAAATPYLDSNADNKQSKRFGKYFLTQSDFKIHLQFYCCCFFICFVYIVSRFSRISKSEATR